MRRVKFTRDFGIKRPGDVCEYDGPLARQLVDIDKVAEDTDDDLTPVEEGREYIEPTAPEAETETEAPATEEVAEEMVVEESVAPETPEAAAPAAPEAPGVEEVAPVTESAPQGDGFDMDTDLTPVEEGPTTETIADEFAGENVDIDAAPAPETVAETKTEEVAPVTDQAKTTATDAKPADKTAEAKGKKK